MAVTIKFSGFSLSSAGTTGFSHTCEEIFPNGIGEKITSLLKAAQITKLAMSDAVAGE